MPPSAELVCVDPARVAEFWPHVRDLIYRAMQRGDLGSFAPLERSVLGGSGLLWLVVAGENTVAAIVTELHQNEWRKACNIVACGGTAMEQWLPLIEGIEQYARAEGCAVVHIVGRKGWTRALPHYRAHSVILERIL